MPGNIGANIRKFRKQAGLTQIELANAVGVADRTIRFWELGKTGPTAPFIKALCEVLKCTEAELLSDTAKVQRFELILDPDDNLKMEVVNMSDTAVDHKEISVSTKRIGLALNINTAGMTKKAVKELMLATFDDVFNNAWESHLRMRKSGAEA